MSNRVQISVEAQNRADAAFRSVDGGLKKNQTSAVALGRSLLSLTGAMAGLAGGLSMGAVVAATVRQEAAMQQLEAAVRSTRGAAGLTTQELADMAAAMQTVTTYGDEAVMEMQAVLLTFTRIGRETFPQATEAILDMATRLNMDLKSAALQVGKALNDPAAGVSALTRAGVQFSEQQKNMIERLMQTGQTAEAQRVILRELETQFGGAARAARNTLGGALTSLRNAFGDLLEAKGGLPEAQQRIEELTTLLQDPKTQQAADAFTSALIEGMGKFVTLSVKALENAQKLRAFFDQYGGLGTRPDMTEDEVLRGLADIRAGRIPGNQAGVRFPVPQRPAAPPSSSGSTPPPPTETPEQRAAREKAEAEAFKEKIQYAAELEAMRADNERRATEDAMNRLRGDALIAQERMALEKMAFDQRQTLLAEGAALTQQMLSPQERFNQEMERLNFLVDEGAIGWETYQRASAAAQDQLDAAGEKMGEFSIFAEQAARNIQGAVANFLFDPFDDGLNGMVKKFGDTMRRMAAEIAASQVLQAVFGAMSGSQIGWMAAVGKAGMAAVAPKHHDGGKFVPKFHFGGLAGDEGFAVLKAGERVFDPDQTKIVDGLSKLGAAVAAGSGGGMQLTQNFTFQSDKGRSDQELVRRAAEEGARRGYEMAVTDAQRRGPLWQELHG
ncbi:phage tail length tape measure family protein [Geoalkalibacter sp.]|uniref:phage tail length tape measure family protein n=1 Tax=Geoalkalibacter sp. TaxID=3041440 RepID=UPI00272E2D8C|nr:phage tail length tape measure family protein [Geoalkalibacter sp.]